MAEEVVKPVVFEAAITHFLVGIRCPDCAGTGVVPLDNLTGADEIRDRVCPKCLGDTFKMQAATPDEVIKRFGIHTVVRSVDGQKRAYTEIYWKGEQDEHSGSVDGGARS